MRLRFRRTKKIAPGVRLNFGKRGMSVRIGPRGFGFTLGTSGARVSAGIPGTGLYVTKRVPLPHGGRKPAAPSAPQPAGPKPEVGTQPPVRWLVATILLVMFGFSGLPYGIPAAALTGWVAWRGYRSPKYVALRQIRAATGLAERDGDAADQAVRSAAAQAADSWTVQWAAATYFVSRNQMEAALEHYANAIRLWPEDPRVPMLQACDAALAVGRYPWIIGILEPHVASMVPEESDLDAGLMAVFALAQLGVGEPGIALELTKRLPLQRRKLTPPLLFGLCVRAMAKHASGQKAGARRDLDRVYAVDPGFPLLEKAQEFINSGQPTRQS